jgi:hypothetical protein
MPVNILLLEGNRENPPVTVDSSEYWTLKSPVASSPESVTVIVPLLRQVEDVTTVFTVKLSHVV